MVLFHDWMLCYIVKQLLACRVKSQMRYIWIDKSNLTLSFWDKTVNRRWWWRGNRADFVPTSLALVFTASSSSSVCLSSLVGIMKVQFAPLDLPLSRRLQTASVLQWVFSFLGLGEIACLYPCLLKTLRNDGMVLFTEGKSLVILCVLCLVFMNAQIS